MSDIEAVKATEDERRAEAGSKRPYRRPVVESLGSLIELTSGGLSGKLENNNSGGSSAQPSRKP